jgi:hypothetical protein
MHLINVMRWHVYAALLFAVAPSQPVFYVLLCIDSSDLS